MDKSYSKQFQHSGFLVEDVIEGDYIEATTEYCTHYRKMPLSSVRIHAGNGALLRMEISAHAGDFLRWFWTDCPLPSTILIRKIVTMEQDQETQKINAGQFVSLHELLLFIHSQDEIAEALNSGHELSISKTEDGTAYTWKWNP